MQIKVTLSGISIEFKEEQLSKAESPIEVTLSGISIELKVVQQRKADSPTEVTLSGIIVVAQPVIKVLVEVSIIALQSSLESYTEFPSFTMIELKEAQFEKAERPIEVTLSGITIELNE